MRHLALSLSLAGTTLLAAPTAPKEDRPLIQVALLLDTSGSMEGLLNQAKSQLWTFVNHFAPLRRDGRVPELQVALYEYGKSSIPQEEGYLRQLLPFTTDLDRVSEQLFALTTNGGDEYCGQVIQRSVRGLKWSPSRRDLKVIFIAGNEEFTQGGTDYRASCVEAFNGGIHVNTIFCGPHEEGLATKWGDGARLGGGSYMNIDLNQKIPHIQAPQDEEIEKLGVELNGTYIPVGTRGAAALTNQAMQDSNAGSMGAGAVSQRAKAKASAFYNNGGWDLVDGVRQGTFKLESVDKKELPKELQKLEARELGEYVAAKTKERQRIQTRIQQLSAAREKVVAEKLKALQASQGTPSLDAAMVETLSGQAKAKGFIRP